MARRFGFAALLVAAISLVGCAATWEQVSRHHPTHDEDLSYFYDDLAAYGTWVEVEPYGWVWCPDDIASAWRPYTVGSWVYTDDGWLWLAEDPWGSVPYHYGRWTFDHDYGWMWVPGNVWAPAWVAWRYGPDWIGWAPLPPNVPWQVDIGIVFSSYDLDRTIDGHCWVFSNAQDFGTHRTRLRVEPRDKNEKLLKVTRNVTRYAAGPRPVEEGMRPDLIRELRGKKLERYRIVDSSKPVSKGGATIRGRQAEVYRPDANVTKLIRERVSAAASRKRPEPTPPAADRVERKREEPEPRILAERDVPREQVQPRKATERQEPIASEPERRKPIASESERRIETKREEAARPSREEVEQTKELKAEARERAVNAEDSKAEGSKNKERKEPVRDRKRESKERTRER